MKSIKILCLILAFILIVVGCEGKLTKSLHEVAADSGLEQQKDSRPQLTERVEKYVYKKTPQGELAIHVHFSKDWTANDKRPAIVFFFGGGWRTGKVEHFVPQAEYLAGRGMVTARADYRVKSRHGTAPDKCVEDAKSAVRWLRANAAKLGIDPNRIAASGFSAGGHIAACTYTTKGLEAEGEDLSVSSKPNLLVLFGAALDHDWFGESLGSKEMAIKISPNHNLTKNVPPTILFYGTKERAVLDGVDFIEKSKKLGNIAELYTAEGQRHWFSSKSPWLERTIYLMDKFLARYGYTQDEPTIKLPEGKVEMKKMSGINLYAYAEDKWDYTSLHRAARDGYKELIELLIANGADVNAKNPKGRTPLHTTAEEHGHIDIVTLLIDKGADVNAEDKWLWTPLHYACWKNRKETVVFLLAKGADLNAKEEEGKTPLAVAKERGHAEIVELLRKHGAKE